MFRILHGFRKLGPIVFTLIALLNLSVFSHSSAQIPPAEPSSAFTIHLPLLRSAKNPSPPPPPPPTVRAGHFALTDWLTYSAATAVDAQGGVHRALFVSDERHEHEALNQPALYSYCPGPVAACGDPTQWSAPLLIDERVNEVQVAVTSDGKPRLLVRRSGARFNEYDYFACDVACTEAENWSGVIVAEDAGGDLNGFALGNHYFALDANDRPRFVFGNGWGNGKPNGIYYAWCDTPDCVQPDSWQMARIYVGPDNVTTSGEAASLAFDGANPRMVINRYTSGLPTGVLYLACDGQCDETDSWQATEVPPPGDRAWTSWDLALDSAGRPRLALYEPGGLDIAVGGALYYGWCDANDCAQSDAWQFRQVAAGEGRNADLIIDAQGRTHMVYDAGQRGVVGQLWCDTGCTDAGSWQRRILETNEQLMADFAPASPLSCSQQEVAWLDALPSASVAPTGELVVAYDATFVARCFFIDPTDPTKRVYSEVKRVWWAVRWALFPRD